MILAAGLGTRLRPLTDTVPKPLLPVAGTPAVVRLMRWLRGAGIREIVINLHHLPDRIEDALGNGDLFDVDIVYSREPELLGTGGGIKKALTLLGDGPFLVINGDVVFAALGHA